MCRRALVFEPFFKWDNASPPSLVSISTVGSQSVQFPRISPLVVDLGDGHNVGKLFVAVQTRGVQ